MTKRKDLLFLILGFLNNERSFDVSSAPVSTHQVFFVYLKSHRCLRLAMCLWSSTWPPPMASRNLEVGGDFGHISYICMYAIVCIQYSIYIVLPIYVIQYLICISNIGIERGERKHHRAFNFLGGCISDKRRLREGFQHWSNPKVDCRKGSVEKGSLALFIWFKRLTLMKTYGNIGCWGKKGGWQVEWRTHTCHSVFSFSFNPLCPNLVLTF